MIKTLKERNGNLAKEVKTLNLDLENLKTEKENLKTEIKDLKDSLKELKDKSGDLEESEKFLKEKIEEVEGSFSEEGSEGNLIIEGGEKMKLVDTQTTLIRGEIENYKKCEKMVEEIKDLIANIQINS